MALRKIQRESGHRHKDADIAPICVGIRGEKLHQFAAPDRKQYRAPKCGKIASGTRQANKGLEDSPGKQNKPREPHDAAFEQEAEYPLSVMISPWKGE
jgi:hypothetical protein